MSAALSIFRVLAACTSTMMILSPMPTMVRIARARVVGHHSIVPLVSMLANCHMNLLYGYMVHNIFPIFATFVFGDVLSLVYIAIFYRFTDDRPKALKAFACFVVPLVLVTCYAAFGPYFLGQTRQQIGQTIGYLSIISTFVLYAAPFEKVALVLQHRSAVFLNIHMVVTGTITNSTWVTYAALASDWIVLAPNIFTVLAGLIQIALYVMYNPARHALRDSEAGANDLTSKRGDDVLFDGVEIDTGTEKEVEQCQPSGGDYGRVYTPRPFHLD